MPIRYFLACALLGVACSLSASVDGRAQADTVLLASVNGQPGQALTSTSYTTPQGTRVHKYIITLTAQQASTLGLMLHTGGSDSIATRIMAVSGRHELSETNRQISAKDLLVIGPTATDPVDCGTAQPCKPNRLVVDFRLTNRPHDVLWVCQVVLAEGD